jgi:hypothetical protein
MGSLQATEMADLLPLEQALAWHLGVNHFPPVPSEMIPVCIEAIEAVNDHDSYRQIAMPLGTTYKGFPTAPAWAIVKGHRLDPWIAEEE